MGSVILGIILGLFVLCFVAIIIEETFLGGKQRRKLEREARKRLNSDISEKDSMNC